MTNRLQVGFVFPQTELAGDPDAARRLCDACVANGFDHVLAFDHVTVASHLDRKPPIALPYDETHPFHDPFVLFAYFAGRYGERLGFVTGVLVLPQRQTALVARQAADLALLTDGQLRLGVGVGSSYVEFESLGQPFGPRGRRIEEQIDVLRRLWAEPLVTFEGEFDRLDRVGTPPRPKAPVPIWIGGFADVALERAAKLADGFVFWGPGSRGGDGVREGGGAEAQWDTLKHLLRQEGRAPEAFGAEKIISAANPAEAVEEAHRWAAFGGSHVSVLSGGLGLDSVEAHVDFLGQFAQLMELTPAAVTYGSDRT